MIPLNRYKNFNYEDGEFTRVNQKSKKETIERTARYSTINLNDEEAAIYGGAGSISSLSVTYQTKINPGLF